MESIKNHSSEWKSSDIRVVLDAIPHFYPLDSEVANPEMPPQRIRDVIAPKIESLIANDTDAPFQQLIDRVVEVAAGYIVKPEMHYQFPNYALTVVLREIEYPEITLIYSIKLRASLLINYFTVFYEETAIHRLIGREGRPTGAYTYILSSKCAFADEREDLFNGVVECGRQSLPGYRFIGHLPLFLNKISGRTPYGMFMTEDCTQYTAYEFMFGTDYWPFPFYAAD